VQARSLAWARLVTPTLLATLFFCYGQALQPPAMDPGPPRAWMDAAQAGVADIEGSAALRLAGQYVMLGQGLQDYGMAFSRSPLLWRAVAALDLWLLLYLVCAVYGLLLLPAREWRRLVVPLTDAAEAPPPRPAQLALFSGVLAFVVLFLVTPLLAWTELWVREQPVVRHSADLVVLHLERIGDAWYRPGTAASLQTARREALALGSGAVAALDAQLDTAFAAMEGRVDDYLDWYYSLGGEYARLGYLLSGNLESYMEERLRLTLQQGDVFAPVQRTLDAALAAQAVARQRYLARARDILATGRVDPAGYPVTPLLTLDLDTLLQPPVHQDLLRFENRLLVSGGSSAVAGVMSAALAAKLSSRMAAKAGFKLAAKSLGKLATGKLAGSTMGAGAGAATGATVGSVVPGVGTAVGAVVGGLIGGIATGLVIDKALIEFEEAVGRDAFKEELVQELRRAREEFPLASIQPTGSAKKRFEP
jgi:hypothetical protein